tara:strand:- start:1582 stop:2613 length:1032 start_codon:yes stop_codon:yes gene_type:complete
MRCILYCLILLLAACAPRGEIRYGAPSPAAAVHDVWAVKFRPTQSTAPGQSLPPRPERMQFQRDRVSVPPGHRTGRIEWPDATPDAGRDFVTLSTDSYGDIGRFAAQVARQDPNRSGETMLFVHGYNFTHGEAVYQMAQILHDFEVPSPGVLFSWPSAATPLGYLYDRDSVLIARDALEQVIVALTRDPNRRLVLVGHSMGSLLLMETLRQIAISGSVDVAERVAALIMIAPDIDGELFYSQASRLDALPDPTVIIGSHDDKVLRLSALLTGRSYRLGSKTDRSAVRGLPVTVIDASAFSDGSRDHSVALESPAAIAVLKNMRGNLLPGEISLPPLIKLSGHQ